jgi:hypothetical protein
MKRNEQIGWFFISLTLAVVLEIALFHLPYNDYGIIHNQNPFAVASSTSNWFANSNSKGLPTQNKNKSPQKPQRVYCIQSASISGSWGNCSPLGRHTVPDWQKFLRKSEPFIFLCFCTIILAVRVLAILHRLARSNPGDDSIPLISHVIYFHFSTIFTLY